MKKFTALFWAFVLLFACTNTISAQYKTKKAQFVSRTGNNWFIGAGAGVSTYFGDEDRYIPTQYGGYKTMITGPAVSIWGGRWISPSVAIKSQFNALHSRGWNPGTSPNIMKGQPYFQNFDHIEMSVDMMFNLQNLFLGYRESRRFFALFYMGPGIANTFNNQLVHDDTHMIFKSGGMLLYKINPAWGVYGELQGTIVPEAFDGETYYRSYEGYLTPMLGVQYIFPGKARGFEPCCECVEDDREYLNRKVNELQKTINTLRADLSKQKTVHHTAPLDSCAERKKILDIVKNIVAQQPRKDLYVPIHFIIDKWFIQDKERYKLNEIATFIHNYPQDTIILGGYADVQTAYPAYNKMLGEKRAKEVIKTLCLEFGISEDKFKWKSFGDSVQPFSVNELNRAVLAVNKRATTPKEELLSSGQEAITLVNENKKMFIPIHFVIDKWYIRDSEQQKLYRIAQFMKQYPQDTIVVGGYADVQTAYPAYNKILGQKRAKEVISALVSQYGIAKERLKPYSFGDSIQPFKINELNRAAIAMSQKELFDRLHPNSATMPPAPAAPLDSCEQIKKEWDQLMQTVRKPKKERLYIPIHYIIDRWDIQPKEMYKLDEIVKFMIKYPSVKVSVTGYADVKTAYPAYNLRLGEKRANEVIRVLVQRYGIDRNRILSKSLGDTVQPFDMNELNRAVIAFDIE